MPLPDHAAPMLTAHAAALDAAATGTAAPATPCGLQSQASQSVALFKQSWEIYQKLLAVDFLEHRDLYAALQALLLGRLAPAQGQPPLSLLDLGCGDAQQIARVLAACGSPAGPLRLGTYTGVDVSAPALALAGSNLAFLRGCPEAPATVQLLEQDMQAYLEACPDRRHDVVLASFAAHHLSLDGKAAFLRQVARCLRPGGALVLCDIFMREGEERGAYMARYRQNMEEAVTTGVVEAGEAAVLMEHIEGYDFPERLSTYRALAMAAGFVSAECLHTDSKEFGRLVVLRSAA